MAARRASGRTSKKSAAEKVEESPVAVVGVVEEEVGVGGVLLPEEPKPKSRDRKSSQEKDRTMAAAEAGAVREEPGDEKGSDRSGDEAAGGADQMESAGSDQMGAVTESADQAENPAKPEDKSAIVSEEAGELGPNKRAKAMEENQDSSQIDVASGLDESADKKKLWFFVGAVAFGIIVTIVTLYVRDYLLARNQSRQKPESTSVQVQNLPPKPQLNLADYSISVLNGSGKTGLAAKTKEMLEAAGFKVGSVGNAATSDFDYTQIGAKSSVPAELLTKLRETLMQTLLLATASGTLEASASADVVVTLGSLSAK